MILLNQWKNKHGFGSLTCDLCVQDDKLSSTAVVLRARRLPHAMAFVTASLPCGRERGEKVLRGARSWRASEYPVAGTLEIAAEEAGGTGGSGVKKNACKQSEIPSEPGVISAQGSTPWFAGLPC